MQALVAQRSRNRSSSDVLLPYLRWHRDRQGYSQEALAKLAGISKSTVMKAEQGKEVRGSSGRALSRALKVSLDELRGLSPPA